MSESRSFSAKNVSLIDLTSSLDKWLVSESFDCQVVKTEDGATIVQIAKQGNWRKFIGMSTALNIVLRQSESNLIVDIGAGRWIDKAAVGLVSMVILWPLLLTAGFGAWQQMKMPERIFDHITSYLRKTRSMLVHIMVEKHQVQAAIETVDVPPGVKASIKRSRTIERTVSIEWTNSSETAFSMGEKDFLYKSVREQIERKSGKSYKESETVEYEVELDGSKSHKYSLIWVDTFCRGTAEFLHGNKTETLPFEFREQTDLQVTPA